MEDYNNLPSNSKSSKVIDIPVQEEPAVQVKVKKKSGLDKLADIFIRDDLESVGGRIMKEIILPNAMQTLRNIWVKSFDMIFKTDSGSSSSGSSNNGGTGRVNVVNYNNVISNSSQSTMVNMMTRQAVYDYAKICFASVDDARRVVEQMREIIRVNRFVTIARYMELTQTNPLPQDYNWCWTNLDKVGIGYTNDRNFPYYLQLPNPVPCDSQQRIYI